MATLNFPDSPDTGDTYSDANSGFEYEWNGTVWISKGASTSSKRSNIQEIDDISGSFNGSTTDFTLTSSNTAVEPTNAQQVVISLGGVLQNVNDDYTISGSTITFTTAPADGLTFFGTYLNTHLSSTTVADGSVSTGSLSASSNYTVGGIDVTGVSTFSGLSLTGVSSITTLSSSNLAVSGVGTIANVIHTKDSSGLGATIGAAVGVVTYYGDASNLTGVGASVFPYTYSPANGATGQAVTTNIVTTWSSFIEEGSGTITIRSGSASGTIVDQFVVGSSSSITIAGNELTLNPAISLDMGTEYFVTYPTGSIKALGGVLENHQLITSFTTVAITLWGWGGNPAGQLGLNNAGWPSAVSSPTQVGSSSNWQTIIHGDNGQFNRPQSAAIKTDGSLWTWGDNVYGGLGLNNTTDYSSPTQVGSGTDWSSVWGNYWNTGAITTDGSLWVWGYNFYGDLGQNIGVPWPGPNSNLGSTSSPVQIPGTTWDTVAGGSHYFVASRTDGTLWAWGLNDEGELGQNNNVKYSSPAQIPGSTWNSISSSHPGVVVANKTDGSLWTWGAGSDGGLGQNNTTTYSSPIQVGTDTTWNTFSAGYRGIMATKTDGTLWTWGDNSNGSLGLNNTTDYSSPTQVGTDTDWSGAGFKNRYHGYAFKTDGTLWGWGRNNAGQVNPDLIKRSSPVQIPGTNWSGSISATYWGALALRN